MLMLPVHLFVAMSTHSGILGLLALFIPLAFFYGWAEHSAPWLWLILTVFIQLRGLADLGADVYLLIELMVTSKKPRMSTCGASTLHVWSDGGNEIKSLSIPGLIMGKDERRLSTFSFDWATDLGLCQEDLWLNVFEGKVNSAVELFLLLDVIISSIPLGIVAALELNVEVYAQGAGHVFSEHMKRFYLWIRSEETKAQGARADRMLLKPWLTIDMNFSGAELIERGRLILQYLEGHQSAFIFIYFLLTKREGWQVVLPHRMRGMQLQLYHFLTCILVVCSTVVYVSPPDLTDAFLNNINATSQLILNLSEGHYLINDTFNYVGSNTKDLVIVGVGPSTIIMGGSESAIQKCLTNTLSDAILYKLGNFSINNVTLISTAIGDENSLFYLHDTSLSLSNIHFTGTHSCTLYIYCPEFCIVEGSQLYSNSSITSFNKAEIFTDYHVNVTLSQVYGTQNGTFFRATSAGDITITDSSSYNNDNMNSRYGAILLSRCEYGIFTIQSCNFSGSNFAAISFEGGNAHGAPIAAIISNSNFESMWGGFNGVIYINDPLAFSATIRNSHFHNINKSSVDGVNQYSCIICYFGQRSNLLIENSTFTNNTANDAIVSSFINPNTESIRYYPNATYRNLIIKDNHSPFVTETIVFASTLMENVSITFPSDLKTVQCGALNVTQTLYNFTADLRLTNVDIENGKTDAWCVDGTYRDVTAQNVTMAVGDQGRFLIPHHRTLELITGNNIKIDSWPRF
ncbi:hypothetical protein PROFUN_13348 [Planoprotostelium fungivorum]|uniref:Adhesin-like protein n=1 Tax=Planoprotostelium fungivorum TaxID=1890364 RepID=A0A2P6N426_9EUKA|nr:hypothetical protein PROFUN_13348 [Planoprotostelium fungivorum]